jgi:amidophosphoribosyltransferase
MMFNDKLHEECAVFGVSLNEENAEAEAVGITYNGLLSLQHRGQEGTGIAVVNNRKITCCKDAGLVTEVFPAAALDEMPKGYTAIGQICYSTANDKIKLCRNYEKSKKKEK